MGGSATQARRGGRLEVLAVIAVLLGMIGGFGAVTAAPADAADCSSQGTFELHRLLVEFGGSDDGTLDGTAYLDTDVDGWCYDGNDIVFTGHTPELHISCSEDLTGITVSGPKVPGGSAVITEFWLDSRNQNDKPNRGLCQDESTFPEPEPDPEPAISLVKDPVVGTGSDLVAGDTTPFLVFAPDDEGSQTALYSYTITNTGDEALVDLTLDDDRLGSLDVSDCLPVLAVGDSCTATGSEDFTVDDAPDTITNTGTVTADGQESGDEVSDTDPATINLVLRSPEPGPAISLVKDAVVGAGSDLVAGEGDPSLVFSPGDDEGPKTALYSYTITNTGDEALVDLTLDDDRLGSLDVSDCLPVLAVGDSCTATGSEDFTVDDAPDTITNTGTVTADGQESGDEVSDTDPATIDLVLSPVPPPDPDAPAIDLVKTAVVGDGATDGDLVTDPETGLPTLSFSSGSPGDQTAVYEYTITNTGPVTLFNVTLTDDRLGTILDESQGVTLAPGESTTERASETFSIEDASGAIDNIITNTAVTTGVDSEDTEVSDTDDAVIQLTAQQASILIDLEKIAVVGAGDVEDVDGAPTVTWQEAELDANAAKTIRYRFTITNVGPSTLHDIELTDDMLSAAPLVPATDGLTLEPGESEVIEVDHTVTPEDVFPDDPAVVGGQIQGDLLNTASVRGSNATRDAFDEDSDDAAVLVRAPRAEVLAADALPATGFEAEHLLPAMLLLLWLGAAAIWLTDRPRPLRL